MSKMKNLTNILNKRVVILDGATGTELQKRGMPQGVCPEEWCLDNPEAIKSVHSDYLEAGADVIYTCTFGANRIKLGQYGKYNIQKVNKELAVLARRAVGDNAFIAGDIGPTGKFVEPFGSLGFEQAVSIFKEQAKGLLQAGVDLFVVETMMDIQEARAALIAIREITDKFTMVTMTYEKNARTLNGTDPAIAVVTLQSLGADAVGCNCSTGPDKMRELVKMMKPYAKVPVIAKPNAGMPKLVCGRTVFDMQAKEFASFGKSFVKQGANILGGCCGTTPEHIKQLRKKITGSSPRKPLKKSAGVVTSARKSVLINKSSLTTVGEGINPTGRKLLQQELRRGKLGLVRRLAKEQEKQGAHLLDVNVGTSGVDEKKIIRKIVNLLAVNSNLPLVIDSPDPEVIEGALRIYPGRALINSISGEKDKLDKLLSVAAKYGAMFILLPLDSKKVPRKFQQRKQIIQRVLNKARQAGFNKEDIVVDGLVMTVSSYSRAALETLKTVSWCSKAGVNTIVGLSNVSFGLPERGRINSVFLSLAKKQGLTMAIMNPGHKRSVNCALTRNLLLGKDKDAKAYVAAFSKVSEKSRKSSKTLPAKEKVYQAILEGNREDIKAIVKKSIAAGESVKYLLDKFMVPAITKAGDLFDKKEYFLPQLIASAEAMKIAFQQIEPYLKKEKVKQKKKTAVLLATVKDDIHDIGKNIVALMLKNHGFTVVDLGKDVSASKIISEVKRRNSPIVGLSALMTTTMVNMQDVVSKAKKEGLDCRFIVGGAVVTKSYAAGLGAEYARDGVEAVKIAKKLAGKKS